MKNKLSIVDHPIVHTVRIVVSIVILQGIVFNSSVVYAQWVPVFNPENGTNIHSIVMSGNVLAAGSKSGVYRSTDSGITWTLSTLETAINVLFIRENDLFAGTHGEGIFRSTSRSESWAAVNEGLTNKNIHSFAGQGNILFAGTDSGLFRSTNRGDTWMPTSITDNYVSSLFVSGNTMYAGLDVWVSAVEKGSSVNSDYYLPNTGNAYASGRAFDTGIYFSSDNGLNWVFTGVYYLPLSFTVNGNNLFAGTYGGGIFHSNDDGKNWSAANSGLPSGFIRSLDVKGNRVFAGTDSGVFISTNSGASWNDANAGLTGTNGKRVLALAVIGDDLYIAVSGSGIWKRPISEMNVTEIKSDGDMIPSYFTLYQNYPNPFNPLTTISFFIPLQCFVSLTIFDLSGREIATPVSEILTPGIHSYRWDGSGYASGIYFYRLLSNTFHDTKRFLLLK